MLPPRFPGQRVCRQDLLDAAPRFPDYRAGGQDLVEVAPRFPELSERVHA